MSKHNDRKHSGRKGVMGTFLALLLIGALAIAVPVIMQDMELNRDAAEYEELRQALATAAPVPTMMIVAASSSRSRTITGIVSSPAISHPRFRL